ncbi:MAG: nucleotidyltransferase family protein [Actinomycetota bacterium]|nr:nucleotidyltransferase family protein [Actinomycetota bacterium]
MRPAGLVLAAGGGVRFGHPKALVEYAGEPLVLRAVRMLAAGGCAPVLAVLGAGAGDVLAAVELPRAVVNPDWRQGMGSSLARGLAALPPESAAVVVALADQPLVGSEAVLRLIAAWRAGAVAAVATYDGQHRNPVLLARQVWPALSAELGGDAGAGPWLRAHPELVTPVGCDGTGSPVDIDTPEDLLTLEA